MRQFFNQCPSCGGDLIITELSCTQCDTVIQGSYTGCTFCDLSQEDQRFVELFVTCRGNIKEMERETGLGYWTIRGKLDEVITLMKPPQAEEEVHPVDDAPANDKQTQRKKILADVENGILTIQEAEKMLADLL